MSSQPIKRTENAALDSPISSSRNGLRLLGLVVGTVVLVGAVCAIYSRVLHAPFIFDDHSTILNNPSIVRLWPLVGSGRQGGPLNPPKDLPTSARPLVNLSLAINYQIGRFDPTGYHAVSFALHALSALLLWAIVRRTL
ncbi:MAG TPA: hypothetical protein VKH44_03015, partial [Pirellulaceae bacterium]|nr:hypothetical protein [Pirellulaceae bacterium]